MNHDSPNTRINYLLIYLLKRLDVTPQKVAELTGIPFKVLKNAVYQDHEPKARKAVQIVNALKVVARMKPDSGINPDTLSTEFIWAPASYTTEAQTRTAHKMPLNKDNARKEEMQGRGAA